MKYSTILFAAALGLGTVAQAQEYQNQSTVLGPGYRQTTYEDGSTSTRTWHVNNATGEITNIQDTNTHAAPVPTPEPVRPFVPFVDTSFNHDGHAYDGLYSNHTTGVELHERTDREWQAVNEYHANVKSGKWIAFRNGE